MSPRPLIVASLIGLACGCLLPSLNPAGAASNTHPCLETLSATALPEKKQYIAPAAIRTGPGETWKLDGVILEHLRPESLARLRRKEIEKALGGQTLQAFARRNAKTDRRGRQSAFIALPPATDGKRPLLQEQLAEQGLVRIDVETLSPACAKHLLAKEQIARQTKRGLWKQPAYQIKSVTGLHLSAIVSTYQIFRGKVQAVTRNDSGTSYLNFGPNWKTDFTVTLNEKSLTTWEAENKSLDALENAYIYVRGWVETRGGPLIRIRHPAQLWQETP